MYRQSIRHKNDHLQESGTLLPPWPLAIRWHGILSVLHHKYASFCSKGPKKTLLCDVIEKAVAWLRLLALHRFKMCLLPGANTNCGRNHNYYSRTYTACLTKPTIARKCENGLVTRVDMACRTIAIVSHRANKGNATLAKRQLSKRAGTNTLPVIHAYNAICKEILANNDDAPGIRPEGWQHCLRKETGTANRGTFIRQHIFWRDFFLAMSEDTTKGTWCTARMVHSIDGMAIDRHSLHINVQ